MATRSGAGYCSLEGGRGKPRRGWVVGFQLQGPGQQAGNARLTGGGGGGGGGGEGGGVADRET